MNAASHVPSGVLICTSRSATAIAAEAEPAAASPAATAATKSRRDESALSFGSLGSSAIVIHLRSKVYLHKRRHTSENEGLPDELSHDLAVNNGAVWRQPNPRVA